MGLENPLHLLLIAIVILMVFGAKRLPEFGRSLGRGMREFKESVSGEEPPPELDAPGNEAPHGEPSTPAPQPASVGESSKPTPQPVSVGAPADESRPASAEQTPPAPAGPAVPPAGQ